MTFEEALKYLDAFVNYEKLMRYPYASAYKLRRMHQLCDTLGNPQEKFRCVHIGGTKGKGSTAAMTESMLRAAGYKTGLYTSPHLASIRERIQIAGKPISQKTFGQHTARVKEALKKQKVDPRHGAYTFFEFLTLIAFLAMAEEKVEVAVLEVGLGGRLDATNVVTPLVVGLLPVSFEHASILGVTLERIAHEKCGIIKNNIPVVSAPQLDVVRDVIEEHCSKRLAPLLTVERDIHVERGHYDMGGQRFNVSRPHHAQYKDLELPLLGMHQVRNAAVAIGLVEQLKNKGFNVSPEQAALGLKRVSWPGRLEVVAQTPWVVLDGAQNADSAQALISAVKEHFKFKRLLLVLGLSSDKDFEGLGRSICGRADEVIFTEADHVRSASANYLTTILGKFCRQKRTVPDVKKALDTAKGLAGPDDLILVTGSLYLVAAVRQMYHGSGTLEDVSVGRY